MATRNELIGLDIGHHTVKAVWLSRRGTIHRTESLRLPTDQADSKSLILPWIKKLEMSKTPCVISLPGPDTMFQPFILAPMDPRTTDDAAAMEVIKFNEMASETMKYDTVSFEADRDRRGFLLAMSRPSALDQTLAMAKELGLEIVNLIPGPIALFNAAQAMLKQEPSPPSFFIDIGGSSTSLAIGSSSGLLFARSFSGGGQMFTDAIARAEGLSVSQAENIKTTEASLATGGAHADTLLSTADIWVSEIKACLSVYQSVFTNPSYQPARVFLAGGGAMLTGLPDYLSTALKQDVDVITDVPGTDSPACFVTAAGLVLGNTSPAADISLLPAQMKDRIAFRLQKPFWVAASLAAMLILGVSLAGGFWDKSRKKTYSATQSKQLSRCQTLANSIKNIKAKNKIIASMAAPVRDMLAAGPMMRKLIRVIEQSKDDSDFIVQICDARSYFTEGPINAKPLPKDNTPRPHRIGNRREEDLIDLGGSNGIHRVVIEGYTYTVNLSSIEDLITELRATGFVTSADLLSDDQLVTETDVKAGASARPMRRFVLDLKVDYL